MGPGGPGRSALREYHRNIEHLRWQPVSNKIVTHTKKTTVMGMVPVCSRQLSREVVQERLFRRDRALSDASGAVHKVGTLLKNTVPVLFVKSEPWAEWHIFHDVQCLLLDAGLDPTID
jgi:hypothetical protein